MTSEERRIHMWQAIVRRAFMPTSDRERVKWLGAFTRTTPAYLNDNCICDSAPSSRFPFEGRFGHQSLLTCSYRIEAERAHFDIFLPDWTAQHGIDASVFAPPRGTDETTDAVTEEDLGQVLRGMIEHPQSHMHLFDDPLRHEVRIGTGLSEPHLFLYQLRFQLCLDEERRERELARLRGIFTPAWFQRRDPLTPWHLFGLR